MQTEISLLLRNRSDKCLHIFKSECTLLSNSNNRSVIVGQGPACLQQVRDGKRLIFFWHCFNFNGGLPGNETVKF